MPDNDDDAQLAANIDTIKRGVAARADAIKRQLFRWIGQNSGPADAMAMTIALLEVAIEGHLVMTENESDTRDFVTGTFRRVARRQRGPVQ